MSVLHFISKFWRHGKLYLINNYKMQLTISFITCCFRSAFALAKYHFLQFFRNLFNLIWKKYFCLGFPFVNKSTQTPNPLIDKTHQAGRFDDGPSAKFRNMVYNYSSIPVTYSGHLGDWSTACGAQTLVLK